MLPAPLPRRRGRPPRSRQDLAGTREILLRAGVEIATEKGFTLAGLDEILRRAGVPKGSFYHYFSSKEEFGLALIDDYAAYFAHKLDRHLSNPNLAPLERLRSFVDDAQSGMARFEFRRGCLVGNLGHEVSLLPVVFRKRLSAVLSDWCQRLTDCLEAARQAGEIPPHSACAQLAEAFWTGWEGAVLRARLEQSARPLAGFAELFFAALRPASWVTTHINNKG